MDSGLANTSRQAAGEGFGAAGGGKLHYWAAQLARHKVCRRHSRLCLAAGNDPYFSVARHHPVYKSGGYALEEPGIACLQPCIREEYTY